MTTSEVCAFCDGEMDARFILSIDGVALCEWCRELPADVLGEYPDAALTFTDDGTSWTCTCGRSYERPDWLDATVLAAVPSISAAMARWHLSGEPMPDLPSERLRSSDILKSSTENEGE